MGNGLHLFFQLASLNKNLVAMTGLKTAFAIVTSILKNKNEIIVQKRAICAIGNHHINNFLIYVCRENFDVK